MVARVEFNDQELPIFKFFKNIITKISEFFINIFKNAKAKFDPNKMVWYDYLLLVIILIPIGIAIIGFIVNLFKGVIVI